mgnify:CR=1 FL=1
MAHPLDQQPTIRGVEERDADVFGRDHYFMEIQAHGLDDQIRVTDGTIRIARALGVAVVAMAWLYFSGRAVVAGSVLNVTLWNRAHARNATAPG